MDLTHQILQLNEGLLTDEKQRNIMYGVDFMYQRGYYGHEILEHKHDIVSFLE